MQNNSNRPNNTCPPARGNYRSNGSRGYNHAGSQSAQGNYGSNRSRGYNHTGSPSTRGNYGSNRSRGYNNAGSQSAGGNRSYTHQEHPRNDYTPPNVHHQGQPMASNPNRQNYTRRPYSWRNDGNRSLQTGSQPEYDDDPRNSTWTTTDAPYYYYSSSNHLPSSSYYPSDRSDFYQPSQDTNNENWTFQEAYESQKTSETMQMVQNPTWTNQENPPQTSAQTEFHVNYDFSTPILPPILMQAIAPHCPPSRENLAYPIPPPVPNIDPTSEQMSNEVLKTIPVFVAPIPTDFKSGVVPPPVIYWPYGLNGRMPRWYPPTVDPSDCCISHEEIQQIWQDRSKEFHRATKSVRILEDQVSELNTKVDKLTMEKKYYKEKYMEIALAHETNFVMFQETKKHDEVPEQPASVIENADVQSPYSDEDEPLTTVESGPTSIPTSSGAVELKPTAKKSEVVPANAKEDDEKLTDESENPAVQMKTPRESAFSKTQKLKLKPAVEKSEIVPEKSKEGDENLTSDTILLSKTYSEVASQDTQKKAAENWKTWRKMGFQSPPIAEPSRTVNSSNYQSSSAQEQTSSAGPSSRIIDDGFQFPKQRNVASYPSKLMFAHAEKTKMLSRIQTQSGQSEKVSSPDKPLQELPETLSELKKDGAVNPMTPGLQTEEELARSRDSDKPLESSSRASHSDVASTKKTKDSGPEKKTSVVFNTSSILQDDLPKPDEAVVPIPKLSDASSEIKTPILQNSGPSEKVMPKKASSSNSGSKKETAPTKSKSTAGKKSPAAVANLDLLTPSKDMKDQIDRSTPTSQGPSSSNSFHPHLTAHSLRGSDKYNEEKERLQRLIDGYVEKIRIPSLSRLAFHKERPSIHPCHDKIVAYWQRRFFYNIEKQRNDAEVVKSLAKAIKRRRECMEDMFSPTLVVLLDLLLLQTDDVILMDTMYLYADHDEEQQPQRELQYLDMLENSSNWKFDPSEEARPVGPNDLNDWNLSNPQLASCRQYINRQFSLRYNIPSSFLVNSKETSRERKVRMSHNSSMDTLNWTKAYSKAVLNTRANFLAKQKNASGQRSGVVEKLDFLVEVDSSIIDFDMWLYAAKRQNPSLPSEQYPLSSDEDFVSLYFS